ncbi:MAG: hypothetical protein QM589_12495 [Thermomicrobiales bacterium]
MPIIEAWVWPAGGPDDEIARRFIRDSGITTGLVVCLLLGMLSSPTQVGAQADNASPVVVETPVETEPAPVETVEPSEPAPVETIEGTEPAAAPTDTAAPIASATPQPGDTTTATTTPTPASDFTAAAIPVTLTLNPASGTLPNSGSTTWTVSFTGQASTATPSSLRIVIRSRWFDSYSGVSCTISAGSLCGEITFSSLYGLQQDLVVSGTFSGSLTVTMPNPTTNGRQTIDVTAYDQDWRVLQEITSEFSVGPDSTELTTSSLAVSPNPGTLPPNGSTTWTLSFSGTTDAAPHYIRVEFTSYAWDGIPSDITCTVSAGSSCGNVTAWSQILIQDLTVSNDFTGSITFTLPKSIST